MLNDRELQQATAQLQDFRSQTDVYHKSQSQLIEQFNRLVEDYKRLKSDYEEERDSRERYKQLAKGQERNPFVLVLVDGDSHVFEDDLVSAGSDGGMRAGRKLSEAIRTSLRQRDLEHCQIVVRMYADHSSLSKTMSRHKLCGGHDRALSPFFAGFNHSQELFDFVDTGPVRGSASKKIRAVFRHFVDNSQCKHIFFAACNDDSHISELTQHSGKRNQITLLRSHRHHQSFSSLDLPMQDIPSVFRSLPVENADTIPMSQKPISPPATSRDSSSPSIDLTHVCQHYLKGLCKFGQTCRFLHVRGGANGLSHATLNINDIKDWRKDAAPNRPTAALWSPTPPDLEDAVVDGVNFKNLLPRDENVPGNQIPINEHMQRLDAYLPTPSHEDRAHFNARVARQKLCNNLHIIGHCAHGPSCQYDHSEITEGMRICLKQVAHNTPCPRRGSCRALSCIYGHICQKPDCKFRGGKAFCKFPQAAHVVDLNVYEYVQGTSKEAAATDMDLTNENDLAGGHQESGLFDNDGWSSRPRDDYDADQNDPTGKEMQEMTSKLVDDTSDTVVQPVSDVASWWAQ